MTTLNTQNRSWRLKRWMRREEGSATIELCIWLPFVLALFGSAIETSFISTRQAMLQASVDRVIRDLTLGALGVPTHDELRDEICNRAGVIPDCDEALNIEYERIDTSTFSLNAGAVQCIDRDDDIVPSTQFTHGTDNELMLMTVCAAIRPMIPVTGLGLLLPKIDGGSYYGLVTFAAFAVEPA